METGTHVKPGHLAAIAVLAIVFFGADVTVSQDFKTLRVRMVEEQISARGFKDKRVIEAMKKVPRHKFLPEKWRSQAYGDHPLPIGHEQTISQPYIVAYMTEALEFEKGQKILEIGTGSGYQAAVLAEMGAKVFTIEIIEPLGKQATALLKRLGYAVKVRIGNGYAGWPGEAPFDGIIVTAAPPSIPETLVRQLAEGGRMVIPVGRFFQDLKVLRKLKGKLIEVATLPVRFVPMTGKAEN
jgi:protein-L-isoaspartate(D-aspartate) O-methyltransferase